MGPEGGDTVANCIPLVVCVEVHGKRIDIFLSGVTAAVVYIAVLPGPQSV